jgi:ankyrin repeat protein
MLWNMDGKKLFGSIVLIGSLFENCLSDVQATEDELLHNELFRAICYDDKTRIKHLIEEGANVDDDCLQRVALTGTIGTLRVLLDFGIGPHLKGDQKNPKMRSETPLHLAALRGELRRVEFLLENGADISAKTDEGYTPLIYLINTIVARAIGRAKNVCQPSLRRVRSFPRELRPLYQRIFKRANNATSNNSKCHFEVLELLIDRGADVNARDKEGNTVLHWITTNGPTYPLNPQRYPFAMERQMQVIKKLIQRLILAGADIRLTNNAGQTPLDLFYEFLDQDLIDKTHQGCLEIIALLKSSKTNA